MAATYKVNSLYWDSANSALYICTSEGDRTTSVWAKVGGEGPTEIDPTTVTPKGAYKYVSPESFLAKTGYIQLTPGPHIGETAKALPGRWRAVKDVPAAVSGSYNVPQPPPVLGVPAGTPLKGDAEDSNVFWIQDGPTYDYCGNP